MSYYSKKDAAIYIADWHKAGGWKKVFDMTISEVKSFRTCEEYEDAQAFVDACKDYLKEHGLMANSDLEDVLNWTPQGDWRRNYDRLKAHFGTIFREKDRDRTLKIMADVIRLYKGRKTQDGLDNAASVEYIRDEMFPGWNYDQHAMSTPSTDDFTHQLEALLGDETPIYVHEEN